ncbi:helix-turn-helix transcriptional regulator [Sphingomonas sp. GB1N7]|uniref:helix-turn-helix transcriptional regulator n=1 Tax=Parasphingomonas caseinilytica TaxID=3096158 RepID=UPI002FCA3FAB
MATCESTDGTPGGAPPAVIPIQKSLRDSADLRHLQQIISGLSEGVILIDPDQTMLWANEAALRMHGVEAFKDLGDTVDAYRDRFQLRYRNNHPLDPKHYPIERVVSGEAFSEVIVEVFPAGSAEPQWVHQVRSLVLIDQAGDPECLVLVLQDVSLRFEAEERFEQSFNANPAPAVICRLSDLRYVKVNQGFLDMTGYEKDQVLGKTAYDVDVLENAERKELAKERLTERRTIPQMEAELSLPEGGTKLVIVAGQPIDLGEEPCMLFTFADLEPRRKAEASLKHSEERFTKTFRRAPVAMAIGEADGHLLCDTNAAFTRLTGYSADEIIGRRLGEVKFWETAEVRRAIEARLEAGGEFENFETRITTNDGSILDIVISTETIHLSNAECVLWVFQDITARKHSELELVEAIEAVMKDTTWFSRSIMEKLANVRSPHRQVSSADLNDLTRREREVLALICRGLDDKLIARELDVSGNTVRNHVARLYGKIGVNRRNAAVAWARERGFDGDSVAIRAPNGS